MAERNHKFMQSLDVGVYHELAGISEERGITVQELIRAAVIPEWLRLQGRLRFRDQAQSGVSDEAGLSLTQVK